MPYIISHSKHYTEMNRNWKISLKTMGQDKDVHFHHFYSTEISSPRQSNQVNESNKQVPIGKEGSEIVTICR
jgi:hypothetical protein